MREVEPGLPGGGVQVQGEAGPDQVQAGGGRARRQVEPGHPGGRANVRHS